MKSVHLLLTVPLLALGCTDAEQATLLEPPAISAAAMPKIGVGFKTIRVWYPSPACTNRAGATSGVLINVPELTSWCLELIPFEVGSRAVFSGGSLHYQECLSIRDRTSAPISACADKTATWKTFLIRPYVHNGPFAGLGAIRVTGFPGIPAPDRHGFRVKYLGQSSGHANNQVSPFDVRGFVPVP